MIFGIVTAQNCFLRTLPGCTGDCNESGIEDEIFSGWAVRAEEQSEKNGWIKIETHYGYQGYIRRSELRLISWEELQQRQDRNCFYRIGAAEADLLSLPKVQGIPLELLLKNAIVELLAWEAADGWSRVRTAAGREGYVRTVYLRERLDGDGYLLGMCREDGSRQLSQECPEDTRARRILWKQEYFRCLAKAGAADERKLRKKLADSARAYLGVQYRWGGKSSQGIDCSGLMFMSYLENGILIFRDSRIHPDFPVREIGRDQLKTGDLIYFPGHVAMYLGAGKYIHSTGFAARPGVGINSLIWGDEAYREDLAQKITACGSIF